MGHARELSRLIAQEYLEFLSRGIPNFLYDRKLAEALFNDMRSVDSSQLFLEDFMDDMLATDVLKSGTGSPVSQDAFIRMLATIDAADLGTLRSVTASAVGYSQFSDLLRAKFKLEPGFDNTLDYQVVLQQMLREVATTE